MLLCKTKKDRRYRIEQMELPHDLIAQLYARGITIGTCIHIIDRQKTGNVVIHCRTSHFALGSYYTQRIMVTEA